MMAELRPTRARGFPVVVAVETMVHLP